MEVNNLRKNYPSISLDALPENYFYLGDKNFVVITDFMEAVRVHIREFFRKNDGTYAPTRNGVSLQPHIWQQLSEKLHKPFFTRIGSVKIIGDALFVSVERGEREEPEVPTPGCSTPWEEEMPRYTPWNEELVTQVTLQKYSYNGFMRHFSDTACVMTEKELNALREIRDEVSAAAIRLKFGKVFRYEISTSAGRRRRMRPQSREEELRLIDELMYIEDPEPISVPSSDASMGLTSSLGEILKEKIRCKIDELFKCHGCEMNLNNQLAHDCLNTTNTEKLVMHEKTALCTIRNCEVVKEFVERNIQLINYIDTSFIESLDGQKLVENALQLYCAEG